MRNAFLFFLIGSQTALGAVSVQKIKNRVTAEVAGSGLAKSRLGLWIGYKGQKVFSLNGEKKFIPASVTKILPATAALNTLRSNYRFETWLYTSAQKSGETLQGDLYLVGGGDPSFTSENLWALVNDFTREGIRRIEGDIVVDDSRFDRVRFDPGRDEDPIDRDKSYTAPVGGMSFNWNSVNVNARPTRSGRPARIFINPETDYIEVLNETRTVSGNSSNIEVERLGIRYTLAGHPRDTIKVKGTIGTGVKEIAAYRNITRPDFWSGANLKSFLQQRGIAVTGTIRAGTKPAGARLLTKQEGKTLSHAVADMMKFSNNYVAEMLTKNLAYKNDHQSGATMQEGLEEIRKFLDTHGIRRENYVLSSPSGLSRQNKFRPKDIHDLIEKMRRELVNFPEFLAAQAIGGVDGTLRNRMKNTQAQGRVRAKTGTLRGVVALAGFALRPDGEVLTFAFMYNGVSGERGKARNLWDSMLNRMME